MTAEVDPAAYSPEALAVRWNVCRATIYNQMKRGELPSFTIGRARRIPGAAVAAIESGHTSEAVADATA